MSAEKVVKGDEIDLIELVKVIWSRKWFITKVTSIFVILGLIIGFTTPKTYKTSCTLIPEAMNSQGKLSGSLGGLASLAGIDLGSVSGGGSTINPGLYRSIAQSTPFLLNLMEQTYYFDNLGKDLSIYEYYTEYYEVSLIQKVLYFPLTVISWVLPSNHQEKLVISESKEDIIQITKKEKRVLDILLGDILVTMDWELNLVIIEVEMQNPRVAAEVAEFTKNYILRYVSKYSTTKSKEQLQFAKNQFEERKRNFEDIQEKLANFRDRNKNIQTASAQTKLQQLQSEYNLAFSIYNQLAQQVEQLKLKVNEHLPVFTTLDPVIIPIKKSKPQRVFIIISTMAVGFIISIAIAVAKGLR